MTPGSTPVPHLAVIGAGLAGIAAARSVEAQGMSAVLFEKARAPGGRICTRRVDGMSFDHGAQYVTIRHGALGSAIREAQESEHVAPWRPRFAYCDATGPKSVTGDETARWAGRLGMSALTRRLSRSLDLRCRTRVTALHRIDGDWYLRTESNERFGPFSGVVIAVPAPQAAELLFAVPNLQARAREAVMAPCWAVMAAFPKSIDIPWDAIEFDHPVLSWAARDSSKPERAVAPDRWVLHASAAWSRDNLEREAAEIAPEILRAFLDAVGREAAPSFLKGHRWRYARVEKPLGEDALCDRQRRIVVCGDWCLGGRAEEAWRSGVTAGALLAQSLLVEERNFL